ncbi:MAG: GAF domain-containing protein [Anaerolineales bacterium]|nr:GAF domain-containing protein [Anaerolineales bacterium]
MSIESLQSQIEALHAKTIGLKGEKSQVTSDEYQALIESLKQMVDSATELNKAQAERTLADNTKHKNIEMHLALQYSIARILSESNGISEASLKVLQVICKEMDWEFGIFWIFDTDANRLYVENVWQKPGISADELINASRELFPAPGEALPGSVYLANKPLWLSDHTAQTNFPRKQAAINSGFNSVVSFPLRKGAGEVLGVMELFNHYIAPPTEDLLNMFEAFASQIGEFMAREYAEDRRVMQMRQQAVLTKLSKNALLDMDLQELLDEACADISEVLSVEFCHILEILTEKQQMLFRTSVGWKDKVAVGQSFLDLKPDSLSSYVLSQNQPISILDLSNETRFQADPLLVENKIISGMSMVISGPLRAFGLLEAHSTERRNFTQDDLQFMQGVAHVFAAAIQHKYLEQELRLSRNQISVILDGIADGITAQNKYGQLIYANDAAARTVGFADANEFISAPLESIASMFKIFDESGQQMTMDKLPGRLALRGESPLPMTIRFKVLKTGEERWSVVKAQPVKNEEGQVMMAVNMFHDITNLKRAELGQRLLAEASQMMTQDLAYKARLNNLANIIVPSLADWCAIDLLDDNNKLQRVAVVHPDPQMVEWAHELYQRFPPDPDAPGGAYQVVRTNEAQYTPVVTEEMIQAVPSEELRELVRKLKIASVIIVPLTARGHSLGTLSLIWAESDHYYTADDLALTKELANRAAFELDNARLYEESQQLNNDLEERVRRRTTQLQSTNLRLSDEIDERKRAEEQFRQLNIDLEQRVLERTRQLENANQRLQREVFERELADESLRSYVQKIRELYEISQTMGLVNTPKELLQALLSSSYLSSTIRASIAVFDRSWPKDGPLPVSCTILNAWNKNPETLLYIGQEMTLTEYGLFEPYSRDKPLIIEDILSDPRVNEVMRNRLVNIGVVGSILFPLVAGGEWYGMISLHFDQVVEIDADEMQHLEGLIDEVAMGIHNFILLKVEAEARKEAEEANNLKLKFLAMISHELRTPLTSIKGFSTTLLADDVEWKPENQRDFIETISSEADKLAELIEQLLNLSRLEAGSIQISPRPVKWNEILSISMAQLSSLTNNHQLVIEEPAPDLPAINVDVMRISQVITNLVNNSAKYSPQNTTITISVAKLSDQFIKVSVTDEGMGIPAEAHSRVFEAFHQLEYERFKTQGAGLGLAICRGLIEAHGGHIWVDDHVGETGNTMSFTLPTAV